MTKPRQAVVVIHGIGEQRPMETLRSFVLGVLGSRKPDGTRAFYSKPDPNANTFELRRYRAFDGREDSDFIELYWQHQMPVAAWRFLFTWLWQLMLRPAKLMPTRFRVLWWLAWAAFVALAAAILLSLARWMGAPVPSLLMKSGIPWGAAILLGAVGFFIRAFVGDAAIYLNPHPRTVEARNAIRASGVALIERLQNDGRYDRIVLVGHSLGSVIGYDILSFAWHRASDAFRRKVEAGELNVDKPTQTALAAAEALTLGGVTDPDAWRSAVRKLAEEMNGLGLRWLVTDFITLGSPLAHASLLLARGPQDLKRRIEERELPICPPFLEDGAHFSFERKGRSPAGNKQQARITDHAALFGLTAWTNLFFPCRAFLYGDLIGGSVTGPFGNGVQDLAVTTKIGSGWLAHTHYWNRYKGYATDPNSAPNLLIDALDLKRRSF